MAVSARAIRKHQPKVSKVDLDRVASLFERLGVKLAEADVTPGRVRLITTDGRNLTIPDDDAVIDRELDEFLARDGIGPH